MPRPRNERMRRQRLFPLVGAAIAGAAPLALLVFRAVRARRWPGPRWSRGAFVSDIATYVFVGVSAAVVLLWTGWYAGRLADRLSVLAFADGLTALPNRRLLDQLVAAEIAWASRHGTPMSVLVLDLDGFKAVNDRYGHGAGDRLLVLVADGLRTSSRAEDLVARIGGDEFAVLLRGTGPEAAVRAAEHIREAVAEASRRFGAPVVTASVGIADLASAGEPTSRGLLAAADEALYRAKRSGSDRVVAAERRHRRRPRHR